MKRAILAIGVDKTGQLPILRAAAAGAKKVDEWARGQGFDSTLLTDSTGQPVTLADIVAAVRSIVEKRTYGQLIVFFSGHGFLKGPDYEIWLLSGAPGNPNEAVNVPGSISLARNCGIAHIAVISDACRSLATSMSMGQVMGSVIFPNEQPRSPRPEVDLFYATLPGDPAMEVPPDKAALEYRGIFTDCLLNGLTGKVAEVKCQLQEVGGAKIVVPSRPLKKYLEVAVPAAIGAVSIRLQQDPEIRVESDLPKYLAEFPVTVGSPASPTRDVGPGPETRPDEDGGPQAGDPGSISRVVKYFRSERFIEVDRRGDSADVGYSDTLGAAPAGPQASQFEESMKRILDAKGRASFETRTGFTVVGASVRSARATGTNCDVFEEGGAFQVRVYMDTTTLPKSVRRPYLSCSTVIIFGDGTGACLAALPEYIGTVLVENGRVVAVNYTPSRYTERYPEYQAVEGELEKRRAFAAAAARQGLFRLERADLGDAARYLRMLKAVDPVLGIYAAYAYAQAGDYDGVKSVFRYMEGDWEPVPFDVALLAHKDGPWPEAFRYPPGMPMLTQGWALTGNMEISMQSPVLEARKHLIPSLWTTFAPQGAEILDDAVAKGELRWD